MESELSQLKNYFFRTSTFMNIYEEAVKNSLDADANKIKIIIRRKNKDSDTELSIIDNGTGFNQDSFNRFSTLGLIENNEHKGIGRVVYLKYYKEVEIKSTYQYSGKWFQRKIFFTEDFNPQKNPDMYKEQECTERENRTELIFKQPIKKKIYKNEHINKEYIKSFLFEKFLPELYNLNNNGKEVEISICEGSEYENNLFEISEELWSTDIQLFTVKEIER